MGVDHFKVDCAVTALCRQLESDVVTSATFGIDASSDGRYLEHFKAIGSNPFLEDVEGGFRNAHSASEFLASINSSVLIPNGFYAQISFPTNLQILISPNRIIEKSWRTRLGWSEKTISIADIAPMGTDSARRPWLNNHANNVFIHKCAADMESFDKLTDLKTHQTNTALTSAIRQMLLQSRISENELAVALGSMELQYLGLVRASDKMYFRDRDIEDTDYQNMVKMILRTDVDCALPLLGVSDPYYAIVCCDQAFRAVISQMESLDETHDHDISSAVGLVFFGNAFATLANYQRSGQKEESSVVDVSKVIHHVVRAIGITRQEQIVAQADQRHGFTRQVREMHRSLFTSERY